MSIEELYKILLSEKPYESLKANQDKLFEFIPELKKCQGFNQNSKWHIYDVYEHILHVVDNVPSDITLRLAALFHDIGKPYTCKKDENGVCHFFGHWRVSRVIFEDFADKYNLDNELSKQVSNLIYYHDFDMSRLDENRIKEVYERLGHEGIEMLYKLKKADLLAQNSDYHYILEEYDNQMKRVFKI